MANTPLGTNTFATSKSSLTTISTTYDSTGSYQTTTSPVDGSSGFILNMRTGWKDYTNVASSSYPIYSQWYMYQTVVYNSLNDLKSASTSATQSSTLSSAQSALDTVQTFVDKVDPLRKNIYDYTDNGDTVIKIVQIVFCVYYAIVIACIGAMLAGTVFFAFFKRNGCRCISHLGWVILTILMILGFLISTVMFPATVVFIDGCDMIKLENLKTDRGIIPQDAWDQIQVCLVGNGDLYKYKSLDTKIGFAATAMSSFSIVSSLYNSATDSLIYNVTNSFTTSVNCWTLYRRR